jgi:hypothetical protein
VRPWYLRRDVGPCTKSWDASQTGRGPPVPRADARPRRALLAHAAAARLLPSWRLRRAITSSSSRTPYSSRAHRASCSFARTPSASLPPARAARPPGHPAPIQLPAKAGGHPSPPPDPPQRAWPPPAYPAAPQPSTAGGSRPAGGGGCRAASAHRGPSDPAAALQPLGGVRGSPERSPPAKPAASGRRIGRRR